MKKIFFHCIRPNDICGRKGLKNPERGFRFEIGIGKIDSDLEKFTHVTDQWPFPRFEDDGVRIAQAYCYLSQFHSSEISEEKLTALQADFDRARANGVKFLLRFAYEAAGISDGPTHERVIAHIKQLTPIVRRNIDVIYVLQTGWVGLWGEFHTSVHGLEKDNATVADIVSATLEMLPDNRPTMMRRMKYKTTVLDFLGENREVTAETAYSSKMCARIGFFNDGTLANYWDGGTFTEPPHACAGNWEYDRIARESIYVPVDGELFWTGQDTAPIDSVGVRAIHRFASHHYSTFSLVHGFSGLDVNTQRWVIDFWKDEPVTAKSLANYGVISDPDYFAGDSTRTVFEFIRDHLGYRLSLISAEFDGEAAPGASFSASITLRNYGFAAPVNKREIEFALVSPSCEVHEMKTGFDCRKLQPTDPSADCAEVIDHKIALSETLPLTLSHGDYKLALWLPDHSESLRYRADYAIRLASDIETVEIDGRLLHILGSVRV